MAAMSRMVVPGMWARYWRMACQPTTMSKACVSMAEGERASGVQLRRIEEGLLEEVDSLGEGSSETECRRWRLWVWMSCASFWLRLGVWGCVWSSWRCGGGRRMSMSSGVGRGEIHAGRGVWLGALG